MGNKVWGILPNFIHAYVYYPFPVLPRADLAKVIETLLLPSGIGKDQMMIR